MRPVPALITLVLAPTLAHAWGPVGHRIVAETAALLVQDDLPRSWGPLLGRHRFQLGVYAFLPDAVFRNIDGAGGKIEAPTHILELDASGKVAGRGGSVPWRTAQFLGRARDRLGGVVRVPGGFLAGARSEGDAHRIFLGLLELGLMAHYSGDAAVPFHASPDWNGYEVGQGGIHFYFENDCVDALEPGLAADVLAAARKNRARWMSAWGAGAERPVDLVLALLRDSRDAAARVAAADLRYAVTKRSDPGTETPAARKPAAAACPSMRRLLVERLAKGAVATASLWETALPAGADFSGGADFQLSDMALDPAYVPPDYGTPSLP
ncbi:MAG TPA: hypothetical protein VFB67_09995 [Candidatus Polarisedimenticolaceae bacterium]|nr:hypothetical protein [Candidatus Polarisedimenticolaceae bacterium]